MSFSDIIGTIFPWRRPKVVRESVSVDAIGTGADAPGRPEMKLVISFRSEGEDGGEITVDFVMDATLTDADEKTLMLREKGSDGVFEYMADYMGWERP